MTTRLDQVVSLVRRRPGIAPGTIARALGMNSRHVSNTLARAVRESRVVGAGASHTRKYYPAASAGRDSGWVGTLSPQAREALSHNDRLALSKMKTTEQARAWWEGLAQTTRDTLSEHDRAALLETLTPEGNST